MAYSIEYTGSFKRDFKKLKKRGLPLELLQEAIDILTNTGKLPERYRPHKLASDYVGCWECHINGPKSDWIMIWQQNDTKLTLLFLRTGTHSDLL